MIAIWLGVIPKIRLRCRLLSRHQSSAEKTFSAASRSMRIAGSAEKSEEICGFFSVESMMVTLLMPLMLDAVESERAAVARRLFSFGGLHNHAAGGGPVPSKAACNVAGFHPTG